MDTGFDGVTFRRQYHRDSVLNDDDSAVFAGGGPECAGFLFLSRAVVVAVDDSQTLDLFLLKLWSDRRGMYTR